MRFLRLRRGEPEVISKSNRYSAADRSDALSKLKGLVLVVEHPYEASPYSGSGNCWCGRWQNHKLHDVIIEPERSEEMEENNDR